MQGCGAAPLALNTLPPSNHAHGEYLLVFVQLLKPRAVAAAAMTALATALVPLPVVPKAAELLLPSRAPADGSRADVHRLGGRCE